MLKKKNLPVIIGIHGLKNKPAKRLLRKWWLAAIREGQIMAGQPHRTFRFELVYWAHHIYSRPLNPHERREGHPRYIKRPYCPTPDNLIQDHTGQGHERSLLSRLFKKTVNHVLLRRSEENHQAQSSEPVLEQMFPDLALYYDNKRVFSHRMGIRDLLRRDLGRVLKKHSGSRILLAAHSMGSIISLDQLQHGAHPIDILLTMGSPLGFPGVRTRFARENGLNLGHSPQIPVPSSITRAWLNLSDTRDIITWFSPLSEHYSIGGRGFGPQDITIQNNYVRNGEPHPHSIFGYLRCAETAEIIRAFLLSDKKETEGKEYAPPSQP